MPDVGNVFAWGSLADEANESKPHSEAVLAISPYCPFGGLGAPIKRIRRIAGCPPPKDREGHRWSPDEKSDN